MKVMSGPVVAEGRRDPWAILRLTIAWTVLVLWVVTIIINSIPAIPIDIAPDLTPLMTLVVGALFAPEAISALRRRNGKDDHNA